MKTALKQQLVSALSVAFTSIINAESIHDRSPISDYEPLEVGEKYTVFAGPAFRTAFEPVEGIDSKHADIMFEIQFHGCTYDKEQGGFSWDGKDYEFNFGNYQDNLMLATGDNPSEDDWYDNIGDFDIDDLEDTELSKAILTPLFAKMSDEVKNKFLMAVFKQVIKGTPAPVTT